MIKFVHLISKFRGPILFALVIVGLAMFLCLLKNIMNTFWW